MKIQTISWKATVDNKDYGVTVTIDRELTVELIEDRCRLLAQNLQEVLIKVTQ